jgi:hypothetical protein
MKTKNNSIRQLAALTIALCVAGGASAAGNLVVNGDFESPAVLLNGMYQCFSNSSFQNWTSAGTHGSCFIQQNTDAFGSAFSGTKLMYVNDFGDTGTQLSQLLTLIAGTTYKLSFEVSGLKGRTGSVGLGVDLGTDHHAVAAPSGGGWTGFSYDYTAGTSGATSLKFTATSGPVNIDAVSVVALPAVPEPESWALMLAGLGAIGLVARRRA